MVSENRCLFITKEHCFEAMYLLGWKATYYKKLNVARRNTHMKNVVQIGHTVCVTVCEGACYMQVTNVTQQMAVPVGQMAVRQSDSMCGAQDMAE
jgi:hypothetical protein